jgi:hypothetical protein
MRRAGLALLLVLVLGGAAVAWWWVHPGADAVTVDEAGDRVQTLARGRMPAFATGSDTAALYRFAAERGDVLAWMPCTCGCAGLGHASNRACYVKRETPAAVTWTSHAAT